MYILFIVLSFAPSAAAVWHCVRMRITCERNSVRHSIFFKRWAGQFVIIIHEVETKADQGLIEILRKSRKKTQNHSKTTPNHPRTTPRPPQDHPKTTPDPKMDPDRHFSRFCLNFGVPLGSLGAPFGEPFRIFGPPQGPKNRKNGALENVCSRARFFNGFSSFFCALDS